jgi:SAM-dependent methyltransferase
MAELAERAGKTIDSLIDVGAGMGIFLEECRTAGIGQKLLAIEPNHVLAEVCKNNGFETFQGFAADACGKAEWKERGDLVTCFEVIEHVLDVPKFVEELAGLVSPGGLLLMTGLCGTGYDILTLGQYAKAVFPPHHLNFLSRSSVEHLLARCNLDLVTFTTPGELDVDIVRNIDREEGGLPLDPFSRHLIDSTDYDVAANFQSFLKENGLSSHMWIVARKPI